jgi:hypothetical protein
VLAAGLSACASRSSAPNEPAAAPAARLLGSAPRLDAVVGCLRRAGADAIVDDGRDLHVSGGEVAVAFSTFDAYVGLASGRAEAQQAAEQLDQQLTVLGQAGQATVRGNTVFYYDTDLVPAAAGRLVTACTRGAQGEALLAMTSLSDVLPRIEFPAKLAAAFAAACRKLGTTAGCVCAYSRATRLFRFGQITELAARPAGLRLAALISICGGGSSAGARRPA